MQRKQKLVTVRVATVSTGEEPPAITPLSGESLEELLQDWRILQIQGLGAESTGPEGSYAALLLLEELPKSGGGGPLGFGVSGD